MQMYMSICTVIQSGRKVIIVVRLPSTEMNIFHKVIIFCLFCVTTAVIEQFSMNKEESALVQVENVDGVHRRKRHQKQQQQGDDLLPSHLTFRFFAYGRHMELKLRRNFEVDFPVYERQGHSTVLVASTRNKNSGSYQDLTSGAAIQVKCILIFQTAGCQFHLMGTFFSNNDHFVILPEDGGAFSFGIQKKNLQHRVFKQELKPTHFDYTLPKSTNPRQKTMKFKRHNIRQKRSTQKFIVELLMIVEFNLYKFWFDWFKDTAHNGTEGFTRTFLMHYFSAVLNGINVRYKTCLKYNLDIAIVSPALIINDSKSAHNFRTYNCSNRRVFNFDQTCHSKLSPLHHCIALAPAAVTKQDILHINTTHERVDANRGLLFFEDYMALWTDAPPYDHAMLFSRADLISPSGDNGVQGVAKTSSLCTNFSKSLIEDDHTFMVVTTAAHELGHSLGANHDGEGNQCSASDNYIMAAIGSPTDDAKALNHWIFSECSIFDFKRYISILEKYNVNCMLVQNNQNAIEQPVNETQLPGKYINLTTQCELVFGSTSEVCRGNFKNKETLCSGLWCMKNSEFCDLQIPLEGSTCGNKKYTRFTQESAAGAAKLSMDQRNKLVTWCRHGKCVANELAPANNDCLFGDKKGIIYQKMDCKTLVHNHLGYCYQSQILQLCCDSCNKAATSDQDCKYGDTYTNCQSIFCYANVTDKCCETCSKARDPNNMDCEYGDKLNNCNILHCDTYDDASRKACCRTCSQKTTTQGTTARTSPANVTRPTTKTVSASKQWSTKAVDTTANLQLTTEGQSSSETCIIKRNSILLVWLTTLLVKKVLGY